MPIHSHINEITDAALPRIIARITNPPKPIDTTTVYPPQWRSLSLRGSILNGEFVTYPSYTNVNYEVMTNSEPASTGAIVFLTAVAGGRFAQPMNIGASSELIQNGGFESNSFFGWATGSGNSTWYVSSADKHGGVYAATITATQASLGPSYVQTIKTMPVKVRVGSTYSLSYWHKLTKTGTSASAEYSVNWYDSAGALLSNTALGTISADVAAWTLVSASAVAPASAVTAEFMWGISGSQSGGGTTYTYWLDDVSVRGILLPLPSSNFFALRGRFEDGTLTPYSDWLQPVLQDSVVGDVALPYSFMSPSLAGFQSSNFVPGVAGYSITPSGIDGAIASTAFANLVSDETPSGAMNGSNVTFTLANSFKTGSVELVLNGLVRRPSVEFAETPPNQITTSVPPEEFDQLRVSYIKA